MEIWPFSRTRKIFISFISFRCSYHFSFRFFPVADIFVDVEGAIDDTGYACAVDGDGNIIPEGEYETLGGYIISALCRIPNQGEHLFLPIGQVVIKKSSARQIHQIQIFPPNIKNIK